MKNLTALIKNFKAVVVDGTYTDFHQQFFFFF